MAKRSFAWSVIKHSPWEKEEIKDISFEVKSAEASDAERSKRSWGLSWK